jgi:hypothetical protein
MKKILPIIFVLSLISFDLLAQKLIAEDLKTRKIRKFKIGKTIGIFTSTDTLYCIKEYINPLTKDKEYKYVGDWVLLKINSQEKEIEVINSLDGERRIVKIEDINYVIFRREDDARYKQILLGGFVASGIWAAGTNSTLSHQKY